MSSRGLALPELLVALAIFGMILGLGATALRGRGDSLAAQGVARKVAEELRAARSAAISKQQPVGVGLPSAAGATPHSGYLYRLEGWQNPRVTRLLKLSEERDSEVVFAGYWASSAGYAPPPAHDFDLAAWNPPHSGDPLVVFLPDGRVVTNLPWLDQRFCLVACRGLDYSAATRVGIAWYELNRIQSPHTVTVGPRGAVTVESGLYSSSLTDQLCGLPAPAPPPALNVGANNDPQDLVVKAFPEPNEETLPPGIDATCRLEGILTLEVTATDPDADHLSCLWTTSDGGAFSAQQEVEMTYEDGVWKGVWAWQPPPGAAADSVYELSCQITDARGGLIEGRVGVNGRVLVLARGRILFQSDRYGDADLFVINADGTDLTRLTDLPGDEGGHSFSGDGSMISFLAEDGAHSDLYVMQHDGSQRRLVVDGGSLGEDIYWSNISPDGTLIAFQSHSTTGERHLYLVNVDGTHPDDRSMSGVKLLFTADGDGHLGLGWFPDSQSLVMGGGPSIPENGVMMSSDLFRIYLDGSPPVNLTQGGGGPVFEPTVTPDGNWVVWYNHSGNFRADPAVVPVTPMLLANPPLQSLKFSPDGTQITYQKVMGPGNWEVFISDADGSNERRLTDSPGMDDSSNWVYR